MKKKTNEGCRQLSLRETARFLKKHNNYIILTHASPDGDTLGSAYALYYALNEIGKVACGVCPDVIPSKYDYFARNRRLFLQRCKRFGFGCRRKIP